MSYDYFIDIGDEIKDRKDSVDEIKNIKESVDEIKYTINEYECKPPSRCGLSNSEPIIPSYYTKYLNCIIDDKEFKIPFMNIEYVTIIKDDIRNMRKLNNYQISHIKTRLSEKDKNDIIDLLINSNNNLIELL
jgi:hypothetical protein